MCERSEPKTDALKGQQYFSPGQARERAALGWYAAAPSGRRSGEPAGYTLAATNGPARATAPTVPAAASPAAPPAPPKQSSRFALKGITRNDAKSLVMIDTGVKTYTFAQGESLEVRTPEGKAHVSLERISDDSVILNVAGQQITVHQ